MLNTSMLLGRVRIALSHSSLFRLVVLFLVALCMLQAFNLRLFLRTSRAFPFKLVATQIATYILLAVVIVPDLNLTRVLVMQSGALAITVTFYGLARIPATVRNRDE